MAAKKKSPRFGRAPPPQATKAAKSVTAHVDGRPMHRTNGEKPSIGLPDALEAAQEVSRVMAEGNRKLTMAVDTLRTCLEEISTAEWDHQTRQPVTAHDLRVLAVEGLDAYSAITGQNWRLARNKVVHTRAGKADKDPTKNDRVANYDAE